MSKYYPDECPILYVDDSPTDHLLFQESVLRTGTPFHIQPFFSGEPALFYLRGEHPFNERFVHPRPALLLCDYDLGETKGRDVVCAVRAISACQQLPIIIFSGSGDDNAVVQSYQAGADHFLAKPLDPHRLDTIVQALYACASGPNCFDAVTRLQEYHAKPSRVPLNCLDGRLLR